MSRLGGLLKRVVAAASPHRVMVHGDPHGKRVALTFDDGPHPANTPSILDALDAAGARATFFMQGSSAKQHPELVRDVHARGHLVANHAFSHRPPEQLGTHAYVREVLDTHALLCDLTGAPLPRLFRPPYGTITPATLIRLLRDDFRFIYWSRDSRDSWLTEAPALLGSFAHTPASPGDIVLFHDDYAQTATALPQLLASLRTRGLSAVTIEEL